MPRPPHIRFSSPGKGLFHHPARTRGRVVKWANWVCAPAGQAHGGRSSCWVAAWRSQDPGFLCTGSRPAACPGVGPGAQATPHSFSHNWAGKARLDFPHASRASRRPSTPFAPSGDATRDREPRPDAPYGCASDTLRVRKRGRDGLLPGRMSWQPSQGCSELFGVTSSLRL